MSVSSVQFLTHVEVWADFDHGFEPGAPTWQQRCKGPEILRARSGKGLARMEHIEQPSGTARGTRDLSDAYCLGHARDLYGGHFGSREDRRRAVLRALRPVDADVADALEAQQAKFYPMVVPRARVRLLEQRTEGLLARTGLTASEVSRPDAELLSRMLPSSPTHWPPEGFERHLLAGFEVALHEALAKAHMGEGTQFSPGDSMRSEVKKSAAKLRQRYEKAVRQRNGALLQDLEQLKWLLYPGGEPQERCYGLAYFAARYGERGVVERVLQAVTPFEANPRDVRL